MFFSSSKMAENNTKMCRICLTHDRDDYISDSSCYAEFFFQVMSLENVNEKLLLCIWCKAAVRRAMAVFKLALESSRSLHNKLSTDVTQQPKRLHSLNYVHNTPIDIQPQLMECENIDTENMKFDIDEITDPLLEIQDDEIHLKMNTNTSKSTNAMQEESTSNERIENKMAAKRKNKEFDFSELNFEVEYLHLEEQLKEVELKKLKFRDFKFQCDLCGVGFLTIDLFEEHKVRHLEISGSHICSLCHLHFKSQDVLSQHVLAHKRRFKCLLCSNKYARWSHCVAHRSKCGGIIQPTACGECSKIFSNEYSLKIHKKVHKTEKKYCCEQCDKKFRNKQRLTVHLRSHSGVKPFSCPQCARSFATQSNLRAHSAVHDSTAPFYCVECHTHYKTSKSLTRHFRESAKHVNFETDMYSCKECSKHFPTEKSLSYHVSSRHGTEHRCTHCDKTFSNNSNLNKHMRCIHTDK